MVVRYVFEAARRDALVAGELAATLRALGRKRHAKVGETITLALGARPLATARVTCRGRLIIGPDALLRVLDVECEPSSEGISNLLRAAEQGHHAAARALPRLAQVLGFASWEALYAATAAHGLAAGDRLWREFIAWSPASLARLDD